MEGSATVAQVLRGKSGQVRSIAPEATVFEALAVMAEYDIGALPVVRHGRLVGIVSERDYSRKVILKGRASRDTRVEEVMTPDPVTVDPKRTVNDCMQMMTDLRVRHLPVLDDGQMVGIVSIGDVVKSTIDEQAFLIEQLQGYIQGTR